jgi:phospholipid-binding lipoprotein MlaA
MKRMLLFLLLIELFASGDLVWAADRIVPGQSVNLLNDEFKDDNTSPQNSISDPLEPMNRVFFEVNDRLYFWVLKPIKTGYVAVVSPDIRQCFGNFFDNLASPVSLLNNLLQGRFDDAGIVLSRFLINTTLGVYGFGDAATTAFNIHPRPADFGQTLGVYGFGEGIYFVWPVIGPSNVRDSFGFVADLSVHPTSFLDWEIPERAGYYMGNKINSMSLGQDVYEDMKKFSVDPYVATRQAYSEYRHDKIDRQKK